MPSDADYRAMAGVPDPPQPARSTKRVYLAGPINGCTDAEAHDWREYASERLPDVLNPMVRDYRGEEEMNVQEIVEGDLRDIAQCDAILANCPRPSVGTSMEVYHAFHEGKTVVVVGEGLSPWLIYHSHYQTSDIDKAIDYLMG